MANKAHKEVLNTYLFLYSPLPHFLFKRAKKKKK